MIYLFSGDDAKNKINAYENFLTKLKDLPIFFVSRNNFNKMEIESFASDSNLFAMSIKKLSIFLYTFPCSPMSTLIEYLSFIST